MNKKLVRGSLAGVAAIALAAGGTTFAAWSDFGYVNGNQAGAGHLVLNVDEGALTHESMRLAPGDTSRSVNFYIASNDGDSVPNGQLYITMQNLLNHEDGCTAKSEAVTEGIDPTKPGFNKNTSCGSIADGNNNGELGSQAKMEIYQYGPSENKQCSNESLPSSHVLDGANYHIVNAYNNVKIPVVELAPGQGTCVMATVLLPNQPDNNKVQGDSMTWDFRFDLEQVIPTA